MCVFVRGDLSMFINVYKSWLVFVLVIMISNVECGITVDEQKDFSSLFNLIDHAKAKGSPDNSSWGRNSQNKKFWAGYQSFEIHNIRVPGCRNPFKRLKEIPYNFTGKTVLDIGTNQGGMLFALADKIKWGVGIDYNSDYVNIANKIKSIKQLKNIDFYTYNVDKDKLSIIKDLIPEEVVDICFLLSVCCWIKKWSQLIDFVYQISQVLLFEANGSEKHQEQIMKYISNKYQKIILVNANSSDEEVQPRVPRKLYLCFKNS
jgi:SAM-dependent methyltransferase